MAAPKRSFPGQMVWPFAHGIIPTPDVELPWQTRGIYVGGDGDLEVEWQDGTTSIFVGLVAGTMLPIVVSQINSAGTTAGDLLALR